MKPLAGPDRLEAVSINCPAGCGWSCTLRTYTECGAELVAHVKEAHGIDARFNLDEGKLERVEHGD